MSVRNPKTGRVLKNPEKFIEQLQWDLKSVRESVKYFRSETQRLRGEWMVKWIEHTRSQRAPESDNLFSLNPGDTIAIVGKVLSVKGSKCSGGNRESEIEYTVLQTRRMPEDW